MVGPGILWDAALKWDGGGLGRGALRGCVWSRRTTAPRVFEPLSQCRTTRTCPPLSPDAQSLPSHPDLPLPRVHDPQNLPPAPPSDPAVAPPPSARLLWGTGEGIRAGGFPGHSLTLLSLAGHQLLASGHSSTPDTPLTGPGRVPPGHHHRPWAGHGDRARPSHPGASPAPAAGTGRSRFCSGRGGFDAACPALTLCPLRAQEDVAELQGRLQRMKVLGQVPSVPSGTSSDLRSRLERVRQLELRVRQRRAGTGDTGDTGTAAPEGDSR